jgi:hypothetical protein
MNTRQIIEELLNDIDDTNYVEDIWYGRCYLEDEINVEYWIDHYDIKFK